jgi:hypothetical protein
MSTSDQERAAEVWRKIWDDGIFCYVPSPEILNIIATYGQEVGQEQFCAGVEAMRSGLKKWGKAGIVWISIDEVDKTADHLLAEQKKK